MPVGYSLHTKSSQNLSQHTSAQQRAGAANAAFFQGITFGNSSSGGSGSTVSTGASASVSGTDIAVIAIAIVAGILLWKRK